MRLANQFAVVTGAARGIGYATAKRLCAEGATVAILDRNGEGATKSSEALNADGHQTVAYGVDVSSEQAVNTAIRAIHERFSRIDILVNAAAIFPIASFEETSFESWRSILSVNLDGTFLCCRAVYPLMRDQGYGRIVNFASATFAKGSANMAAYVSSKGGVIGLTRVIASEGGPHGITANAVAPGVIASEGVLETAFGQAAIGGVIAVQAVKRTGQPDDIADTVAWLASPASGFMTGQTILVNGGTAYS